jgi:lysozyme
VDAHLINDVKGSEGCRLTAYKDTLGNYTIGYGHLLDQDKDWTNYTITQDNAEAWLINDLQQAYLRSTHLPEWAALDTLCRQNAIIELMFNMGGKWLKFYKTRLDISHQDWQSAHDDLLNSLWAKQVGKDRSERIANYLLNGQYKS